MAYYCYTKVRLLLLILFVINTVMMTNAVKFNPTITEIFVNGLSKNTPPLNIHCQSRDDDLKVRILKVGKKFDFSFHQNFWGNTHFYCNFEWGSKHKNFDVFYKQKSPCRFKLFKAGIFCIWLVKDSGIFFARSKNPNPSPSTFRLVYPW
ncbi:putative WAT1-related protein-like [Capsicum annuum]